MDLKTEPLDNHQVLLTITLDDETVNRARREVARDLSKQVRIPGFRPGHAPLAAVIRAIGGEEVFNYELAEHLTKQVYSKALDEAKIDPYGPGKILKVNPSPFQIIVHIDLEPTVELKDYKSIRLPFPEVTVSDQEIEQQLAILQRQNAIVELAERPAQHGDLVEADIEVRFRGNEEESREFSADEPFVLDAEDEPLPGLADLIVGMSAGEHKEATLTLPEDFGDEALRGTVLDVSIDLRRVNSRTLPDINDELAQTVSRFDTLAELRENLRQKLLERKQDSAEHIFTMQALDAFTTLAEVRYPPDFVEDQLKDLMEELVEDIERREEMPFEEWLKLQSKTRDQVREELRPTAEQRGRRGLVMRALAQAEGLSASDEEIAAELESIIERSGSDYILNTPSARSVIGNSILSNKVLRRMAQIARGEVEPQTENAAS